MTKPGTGTKGRLIVRLEGQAEARSLQLPVEVRTPFLLPVAHGMTEESIPVAAGEYVVSTRPPGGEPLLQEVRVDPGEECVVTLSLSGATPAPAPVVLEAAVAESVPAEDWAPAAAAAAVVHTAHVSARGLSAYAAARPSRSRRGKGTRGVSFHLLTGNPLAGPLWGRGAPSVHIRFGDPEETPRMEVADGGEKAFVARSTDEDALVLDVTDPGLPERSFALLRITERGIPVRFVAAPVAWGQPVSIALRRVPGQRALRVATHPHDPVADALLHYRRAGQVEEARMLLRHHRDEAFGSPGNAPAPPLRLAVIALLTIRLDSLGEKADQFFGRLVEAARTLKFPDLYALGAEVAASAGDATLSRELAMQALEDGLPYLGDSLALLHARLLEWARPPRPDEQMKGLYRYLAPMLELVDLKPVLLTLRGGDQLLYRP